MQNCPCEKPEVISFVVENIGSQAKTVRLLGGATGLDSVDDNTEVISSNIQVVATPSVGTTPLAGTLDPVNERVYVANQGSNNVSVIDTSTNAVIATISTSNGPRTPTYNSINECMYVSCVSTNRVNVISTATNTVIANIVVGTAPRPSGFDPVHNYIYVPNSSTNNVSVIDASSNTVIATISTGADPASCIFDSVHNRMYVPCITGSRISVIDTATNTVTDTILLTQQPSGNSIFDPDTLKLWVGENNTSVLNILSAIDTTDNSKVDMNLPGQVLDLMLASNGYIYASSFTGGMVYVIDQDSYTIINSITVGTQPRGGTEDTVNNLIYIPNQGSNNVSIFNVDTSDIVDTISVGSGPTLYPVFDSVNQQMFVSNTTGASVSVIGTSQSRITPVTITVNGGQQSLEEINRDILADPINMCELKITASDKDFFNRLMNKNLKSSTGTVENASLAMLAYYTAQYKQGVNVIEIPGQDFSDTAFDGSRYLQFTIGAGELVELNISYCKQEIRRNSIMPEYVPKLKKKKKYVHAAFNYLLKR